MLLCYNLSTEIIYRLLVSQVTIDSKAVTKKKSGVFVSNVIHYLLFYVIITVLFISGIAKIIDPLTIVKTLEAFKLFSFTSLENEINIFIATTLPILEIGLAILLITKTKLKVVLPVTLLLFTSFLFSSIYGYYLGITNDCGCFGSIIKSEFGWGMVVRNVFLLLLNVMLIFSFVRNTYKPNAKSI